MKNLLWRFVYALLVVIIVLMVAPLVIALVGFPLEGNIWPLLRLVIAIIAVLYIVFGPPPAAPF